jgi:hypothetical protein
MHIMHLRPGVAKQPDLELKTRPKQLLGSLPLVIALPGVSIVHCLDCLEGNLTVSYFMHNESSYVLTGHCMD